MEKPMNRLCCIAFVFLFGSCPNMCEESLEYRRTKALEALATKGSLDARASEQLGCVCTCSPIVAPKP